MVQVLREHDTRRAFVRHTRFWFAAGAAVCLTASACTTADMRAARPSVIAASAVAARPQSFEQYRDETVRDLQRRRSFQGSDTALELAWNAPREWWPRGLAEGVGPAKGILLVHGLGDSPWSFNDIAPELAKRGFLVRTILLPGHGTRPEDMMHVTVEDWRRVVERQAETMRREVGQLYLGGFSTGANLALEYAYQNDDVAGLVLISPGFKSLSLAWLAPPLAKVRPWLIPPKADQPLQNAVRYMMVPTNGFAQFYHSSRAARRLLDSRPYDKPVFMAVAEHDSVLDTDYLRKTFERRFTHPGSRLIWYGSLPESKAVPPRILVRPDHLPERRISQFSHMGLLFAPVNPLYGENGSLRFCFNGQARAAMAACETGALVWYSDWGYREKDKIHARLTFNPYFEWQTSILAQVVAGDTSGGAGSHDHEPDGSSAAVARPAGARTRLHPNINEDH